MIIKAIFDFIKKNVYPLKRNGFNYIQYEGVFRENLNKVLPITHYVKDFTNDKNINFNKNK